MSNTGCLSLKNLTILIYLHCIQLCTDAIFCREIKRKKQYKYVFFLFYHVKDTVRFNAYKKNFMNLC